VLLQRKLSFCRRASAGAAAGELEVRAEDFTQKRTGRDEYYK